MMNIIKQIQTYATATPHKCAIRSNDQTLTYHQLEHYSNQLAAYLIHNHNDSSDPIVVYGHKQPLMLVCFLACVKSGHAYCPIDISVPLTRTQSIIDAVQPPVTLAVSDLPQLSRNVLSWSSIEQIITSLENITYDFSPVSGEDTFYIIFTSGSSGTPKGVQITSDCLNHYLDWAIDLGIHHTDKEGAAFLNQAPFSFDLSVMDLYTCLACGGTLVTLDKETQSDYNQMFRIMEEGNINIWVSTPSFVDLCLSDKKFCQVLLPNLRTFLFCGETLTNHTAQELIVRFPQASVINTYGPTESTVAVTEIHVTEEINSTISPLPVGKVKPGSIIEIWNSDGEPVAEVNHGEIIIIGDTVSSGYYQQKELTDKAFFHCVRNKCTLRGYHTGDEGYLKDGLLYYCGRIDLQIKLHGYRMELEDIEQNLMKVVHVKGAAVTPNIQEGKVRSLTAHIVYDQKIEDSFQVGRQIKTALKSYLPDYMIPKKINFLSHLPLTVNGKCDRKKLGGLS